MNCVCMTLLICSVVMLPMESKRQILPRVRGGEGGPGGLRDVARIVGNGRQELNENGFMNESPGETKEDPVTEWELLPTRSPGKL